MRYKTRWNPLFWLTSLFTNEDDPRAPARFWPSEPEWKRAVKWWFRNPLHDFTHYVIGFKGSEFRSWGNFPRDTLLPEEFIWAFRFPKWFPLPFPFISYQHRDVKRNVWQFYIGWRDSGAFGIKLRRV